MRKLFNIKDKNLEILWYTILAFVGFAILYYFENKTYQLLSMTLIGLAGVISGLRYLLSKKNKPRNQV